MAKIIDGEVYLSPLEASALVQVSYKTLQRWAEDGAISVWVRRNGGRERQKKKVDIDFVTTGTGYRYYRQHSIQQLANQVNTSE